MRNGPCRNCARLCLLRLYRCCWRAPAAAHAGARVSVNTRAPSGLSSPAYTGRKAQVWAAGFSMSGDATIFRLNSTGVGLGLAMAARAREFEVHHPYGAPTEDPPAAETARMLPSAFADTGAPPCSARRSRIGYYLTCGSPCSVCAVCRRRPQGRLPAAHNWC